ncbi:MAG: hypothetical protein ABIJ61_06780, partial [bacterium]
MTKSKWTRVPVVLLGALMFLYVLLLIPSAPPQAPEAGEKTPFVWNQDEYWNELESRFREARLLGCDSLNSQIARGFLRLDSLIATIHSTALDPSAAALTELEAAFFEMSLLIA